MSSSEEKFEEESEVSEVSSTRSGISSPESLVGGAGRMGQWPWESDEVRVWVRLEGGIVCGQSETSDASVEPKTCLTGWEAIDSI